MLTASLGNTIVGVLGDECVANIILPFRPPEMDITTPIVGSILRWGTLTLRR